MVDLTFFEDIKAEVADSDWLELSVLDGSLIVGAAGADHLATGPAVVPPHHQAELDPTQLAHGDPLVRDPDGGGVSQGLLASQIHGALGVSQEAGLLTVVFLYSTGDGLHPLVPLVHIPVIIKFCLSEIFI